MSPRPLAVVLPFRPSTSQKRVKLRLRSVFFEGVEADPSEITSQLSRCQYALLCKSFYLLGQVASLGRGWYRVVHDGNEQCVFCEQVRIIKLD